MMNNAFFVLSVSTFFLVVSGFLHTSYRPIKFTNRLVLMNDGGGDVYIPKLANEQLRDSVATVTSRALSFGFVSSLLSYGIANADETVITRADVGLIDLNVTEPEITDVCWFDVTIGENSDPQRVEISLFGKVTPIASANFKSLCKNELGWGYKGSEFFRVISTFSVQGGNIGQPANTPQSQVGRYGRAGSYVLRNGEALNGVPFAAENYRILHSYRDAGVVSMMRDVRNKNLQDSRFFVTTSPYASWADDRYEAFGRVTKGMSLITAMQIVPVQAPANYPLSPIRIVDSGCY